MRKILLLTTMALLALFSVLSAQITQKKADRIVLNYVFDMQLPETVFAKEGVQKEMTITTSSGEIVELDYNCWVYFTSDSYYPRAHYSCLSENDEPYK